MASQQQFSFRPLEYWKPPKAVQHIRAKSSSLFTPAGKGNRHSFANPLELGDGSTDKKDMSFANAQEYGARRKNVASDQIQLADDYGRPLGPPPGYKVDREDTLNQPWYDAREWGKKAWIAVGAIVVLVIVIVVIIAVEVSKKNKYPDYTKLNYSLAETCEFLLFFPGQNANYCPDSGKSFFNGFDYFTGYDPSYGFVHYVPEERATALNLTYAGDSSAILRVDTSVGPSSQPNASTGRFSVRVTSKQQYGLNNLFIFDVKHSPMGCGTWPALWLTDPSNWPTNGEIDVMEAVNVVGSTSNQMTLHTSSGCTMNVKRKETGKSLTTSCVNSTDDNAGCGVDAGSTTFGSDFNSAGGAVMAMELRSAGIRVWQFGRSDIPSDITSGSPDPSTWPEATADFPGTNCDIGTHFRNQSIIANIDLCGSWAGAQSVYSQTCMLTPSLNSSSPSLQYEEKANHEQVVLVFERTLLRITMVHSRMRIGNSAVSRFIRLIDLMGDINSPFS
jgi:hypothetical protein